MTRGQDNTTARAFAINDRLELRPTAALFAEFANPEGTVIKSTGETGGTKFLREDGDNTSSWQAVPAGGVDGIVSTADATAITIDSNENVSVGASSIMQNFGSNRTTLAVKGVGTDNYSSLQLGNGGSTTSGKYHGFVNFYNNNTSVARVASISNSNAVDADLTFFTAPSGGGIQERLRLTSDGRGLSQFTAKAWINLYGKGTINILDSHNVSSITDLGVGRYRVTFSNSMSNTSYSAIVGGGGDTAGTGEGMQTMAYELTTSYASISSWTYNGSGYLDMNNGFMQVFGD
jgi:hypothetical protein